MTEALSPLRDLADQETSTRRSTANSNALSFTDNTTARPTPTRKQSSSAYNPLQGQQTERYLKRYIEIFREQSFATISMYRNIFPEEETHPTSSANDTALSSLLSLPSALDSFPLHFVSLLTETLKRYLPNITDPTARESLLMQVLYAASSLGRLGADFSLMIALLDEDEEDEADVESEQVAGNEQGENADNSDQGGEAEQESQDAPVVEPEWVAMIKKHRVQAARLEALAAGQDRAVQRRESSDIAVR